MTKTYTVDVAESRITDLRLEGDRLYVAGVDVDHTGASVRGHSRSWQDTDKELPPAVRSAIRTIRNFGLKWVEDQ